MLKSLKISVLCYSLAILSKFIRTQPPLRPCFTLTDYSTPLPARGRPAAPHKLGYKLTLSVQIQ